MVKKVFYFSISLLVTCLILEMFLQKAEINSLSISKDDVESGVKLIPNKKIIKFNEGFYLGGTNDYGYFGPSYPPEKDSSTYRVALLGDSYVEGLQVLERDHFRTIIENKLDKAYPNTKVEVLNFGLSGYNLGDCFCYYHAFVESFSPDLVFVFVAENDIYMRTDRRRKPTCIIADDKLKIDYSFNKSEVFQFRQKTTWMRGQSIVLGYILQVKQLINEGKWKKKLFDKLIQDKESNNSFKSFEYKEKDLQLNKMIIDSLEKKDKIYFVLNTSSDSVFMNLFQESEKIVDIKEWDTQELKYWKTTKMYGHWNSKGHLKIGESLSNFIIESQKLEETKSILQ